MFSLLRRPRDLSPLPRLGSPLLFPGRLILLAALIALDVFIPALSPVLFQIHQNTLVVFLFLRLSVLLIALVIEFLLLLLGADPVVDYPLELLSLFLPRLLLRSLVSILGFPLLLVLVLLHQLFD